MSIDILESDFTPGDTVYVLATGPAGKPHWSSIPDDAFVIAVNQAIEIHDVNKSIWLCADGTLPDKKWFREHTLELIASNYPLDNNALPTPVFSTGTLLETYPDVPYYFEHGHSLAEWPHGCETGVLRGGATISSQAVQLAYHLSIKRIILCGVDMNGDEYYHGGKIDNKQLPPGRESWIAKACFDRLIKWLYEEGFTVESMSKTALNMQEPE